MPDRAKVIEALKSIANHLYFGETIPLGDFDMLLYAEELLQPDQQIIDRYKKADSFLAAHGWDWEKVQ